MNNSWTKKVPRAVGQFRDKSNKMAKSTTSGTIYLSGSPDIHSGRAFIETLIQFFRVVTL